MVAAHLPDVLPYKDIARKLSILRFTTLATIRAICCMLSTDLGKNSWFEGNEVACESEHIVVYPSLTTTYSVSHNRWSQHIREYGTRRTGGESESAYVRF